MIEQMENKTAPAPTEKSGVVEQVVNVKLEEADYEAIKSTKQDFGAVVNFLTASYAKGGIMIPPEKVAYLSDLCGDLVMSSSDVVEIIENVKKKNSTTGALHVSIDVDPAFSSSLEDMANAQGRSVNEIVQEAVAIILTNSWIYGLELSGGTIPFTADQRVAMEKVLRKSPLSSEDIVGAICSGKSESRPVSVPDKRSGKLKGEGE